MVRWITQADVDAAMQVLKDAGRNVTVLAVREVIGSGSFTTISRMMGREPGIPRAVKSVPRSFKRDFIIAKLQLALVVEDYKPIINEVIKLLEGE